MQRTQSIKEFQQLMKNDATSALRYKLSKLELTSPPENREVLVLGGWLDCMVDIF